MEKIFQSGSGGRKYISQIFANKNKASSKGKIPKKKESIAQNKLNLYNSKNSSSKYLKCNYFPNMKNNLFIPQMLNYNDNTKRDIKNYIRLTNFEDRSLNEEEKTIISKFKQKMEKKEKRINELKEELKKLEQKYNDNNKNLMKSYKNQINKKNQFLFNDISKNRIKNDKIKAKSTSKKYDIQNILMISGRKNKSLNKSKQKKGNTMDKKENIIECKELTNLRMINIENPKYQCTEPNNKIKNIYVNKINNKNNLLIKISNNFNLKDEFSSTTSDKNNIIINNQNIINYNLNNSCNNVKNINIDNTSSQDSYKQSKNIINNNNIISITLKNKKHNDYDRSEINKDIFQKIENNLMKVFNKYFEYYQTNK